MDSLGTTNNLSPSSKRKKNQEEDMEDLEDLEDFYQQQPSTLSSVWERILDLHHRLVEVETQLHHGNDMEDSQEEDGMYQDAEIVLANLKRQGLISM
jgi:hypothetical protein